MWGARAGGASNDSAFGHNIQQEVAQLLGEHTWGMSNCHDLVDRRDLLRGGQELGFPLRLGLEGVEVWGCCWFSEVLEGGAVPRGRHADPVQTAHGDTRSRAHGAQ
eukprot:9480340-Pyramimonas_sp.AAC.1